MPITEVVTRISLFLAWAFPLFAQQPVALQNASVAAQQQAVAQAMRASLELQVASVRKQAKLPATSSPAFFVTMAQQPPEEPDFACGALTPMRAGRLVEDASRRSGIGVDLLNAVIQQESAFRPCAVSNKGARGLMQLMPATMEQFGVTDAFDPEQNVFAGAALLKELMSRYSGDLNRVLGAYNAGPARVEAADGIPMIPETQDYVRRILAGLPQPALP